MTFMGVEQSAGDSFRLRTTDPRHIKIGGSEEEAGSKDFAAMMFDSLKEVNTAQQKYADLSVMAVTDPESVDPHDITIAGAEANLTLNIAKNVIDRVIRAYRDITSLR